MIHFISLNIIFNSISYKACLRIKEQNRTHLSSITMNALSVLRSEFKNNVGKKVVTKVCKVHDAKKAASHNIRMLLR